MLVLKTRTFARWARKERLSDSLLRAAADEMRRGLVEANLGGGLLKKRVARSGEGKRGGYRTLVASNLRNRWIFLYGFAKKERDNLDDVELRDLKLLARAFLGMHDDAVARLVAAGELLEVNNGETQTS